MDTEKEIQALSAETLAFSMILGNVLANLAKNASLRAAITEGFDRAADGAESIAIQFGKSASPEHTVKAMRIVEEMRAVVLGNVGEPKNLV